jgi:uncharacterized protein (DUF58 family)
MTRALGGAAFGAALILSGATFDTPSLYVPGVALVVLGLGAAIWVALAAKGAGVMRLASLHSVQEEEGYPLRILMRAGLLPPPGGHIDEPLLQGPLAVRGQNRREVTVKVRFGRRGRRTLEPTRLTIRDPLGLAEREFASDPTEVLVLPRIEPVLAVGEGGEVGRAGSAAHFSIALAEMELDTLRPYRPGTPASRIHWPTVARTGQMMERKLVADADSRPLVVLDPRTPPSEAALDQAVRAAASLVVHLAHAGGCSLLMPGDRRPSDVEPDLHAWAPLHARLALVEADDGAPALRRRLERSGSLFWVTPCGGALPHGLGRAAAAARYLVAPEPAPGAPVLFTVAGCSGQRIRAGVGASRSVA